VKPWELLGEARTPEGTNMTLVRRGGDYLILADGKDLMSSRMHGSEEALATLGCAHFAGQEEPCVLIGGLGMGFTLAATLALLPRGGSVVVAELMAAVVEWNRGPLGSLTGHPVNDPRVTIECRDVALTLADNPARFDAVLLDVDNGPAAFSQTSNAGLYGDAGLTASRAALKPNGVLAVWSAWDDKKFEHRLRYNGFTVETVRLRARLKKGGPRHTIFLASPSTDRSRRP
jgi:spermidine synthase